MTVYRKQNLDGTETIVGPDLQPLGPTKHRWQTINRGVHQPEELAIADVLEEIRCALMAMPEDEFILMTKAIDNARYDQVGEYVADGFTRMSETE